MDEPETAPKPEPYWLTHVRRELADGMAVGMIYVREMLLEHDRLRDRLRGVEHSCTEAYLELAERDKRDAEEPRHEIQCPNCETTIRARMADAPELAELEKRRAGLVSAREPAQRVAAERSLPDGYLDHVARCTDPAHHHPRAAKARAQVAAGFTTAHLRALGHAVDTVDEIPPE